MKPKKRLINLFTTCMIAALLLTGAVPYFGWDEGSVAKAGLVKAGLAGSAVYAEDNDEDDGAQKEQSVVLPAIEINGANGPKVNGQAAIAMDLTTGTVVYEKNADEIREPASLTKVLNALVVLETLDLDEKVTIRDDIETEGSVIYLEPGEIITVEELLYGMMLPSGNDAAEALAVAAGGSVENFSDMMNARAKKCGAKHTDFRSPNGLNEDPNQLNYTTARDLALITREAMQIPEFRKIVSTKKHTIPATNKSEERKLVNSNVCLWRDVKLEVNGKKRPYKYKGCNGVKTGFTSDAGYCLIGSAEQNGTDFIALTLGADGYRNRCRDVIKMWDFAFDTYETCPVLRAGDAVGVQRIWGGEKRAVDVGTKQDLGVTIEKGTADEQDFTTEFRLNSEKVDAPVKKGQEVGQALVFNARGRLVGKEDLYTLEAVKEGGPLSHIGIADEDLPLAGGIAAGALLLLLILILAGRSRRRRTKQRRKEAMRGELTSMRAAGTGMTAKELTDVTGVKEYLPIRKGPARISDEELTAWNSMKQQQAPEQGQGTPAGGSRFSSRGGQDGYSRGTSYSGDGAPHMQKMQITPRTPFTTGTIDAGSDQPPRRRAGSMSDEELFAMLESTEVYDANQPRRHGRLTDTERREVMQGAQSSERGGSAAERLAERRRAREKRH